MIMKNYFMLFVVLLSTCLQVTAQQVSGLSLGYCEGQKNDASTSGFYNKHRDQWGQAAIYIPAEKLSLYAGSHIDSIRVALVRRTNIDTVRVWLRNSLKGNDLASGLITKTTSPAIDKGWNTVGLSTPFTISNNSNGLYVGFSYHQTNAAIAMSVLPQAKDNALFVKMGTDSVWADRSNKGTLAIEALLYGATLPKHNLQLKSFAVERPYIIDKGTLNVTAVVKNIATVTITSYDLNLHIEGLDSVITTHVTTPLAYNEEQTLKFTVSPAITDDTPKLREATLTIDNLAEGEDEDMSDNTGSDTIMVIRHSLLRNVVLEEFTTEHCSNCPRVAGYVEDLLSQEPYASRVFQIEHHAGYYTDFLTIPADTAYTWFYNSGNGTYAPAVMIDRQDVGSTPVFLPSSESELAQACNIEMADEAPVSVSVKVAYNESTGKIDVNVTGERTRSDITMAPARMTVVLCEDSIKAVNQAGAGPDFYHHHVGRMVNDIWGKELAWDGTAYDYDCTFDISSQVASGFYDPRHLEVVAFISDYDAHNVSACTIVNAGRAQYADFQKTTVDGIAAIATARSTQPTFYSVNGLRLTRPQHGLNIIRTADGKVRKVWVK